MMKRNQEMKERLRRKLLKRKQREQDRKCGGKKKNKPGPSTTITKLSMDLHSRDNKEDDGALKSLHYNDGHLFLDGKHVQNSAVHDDNKIVWTRKISDGLWEHGAFKPNTNYQTGSLISTITEDKEGSKTLSTSSSDATTTKSIFNCKRSLNAGDETSATSKDDLDFGILEIDHSFPTADDEEHKIPWVTAKIQWPSLDEAMSFESTSSVTTEDNRLHVCITVPEAFFQEVEDVEDRYVYFECKVGILGDSFDGFCYQYDPDKDEGKGEKYHWYGSVDTSAMVTPTAAALVDATPTGAVNGATTNNNISQVAFTSAAMLDQELSVVNLLDLDLADPDDTFMSYMSICATHEIDSKYREEILGKADPDFTGRLYLKEIAEKYSDFFKNDFGIAYMLEGLSKSSDLAGRFTEDYKNKLASYWQGATDGCLAKSADFNEVHREISRIIYLEQTVGLQAYIDDGGEGWAKQLFDAISTPYEIKNIANVDTYHNGLYQKYVMLLYCLDPDTDYVSQLQEKILTNQLQMLQTYFDGGSETDIVDDITEPLCTQMLAEIMNGDADLYGDIQAQITELGNEMEFQSEVDLLTGMNSIFADLFRLAFFSSNIKGSIYQRIGEATDEKVANMSGPGKQLAVKLFGRLALALGYGYSLYSCISSLMNWDQLTDSQRSVLILQTVQYSLKTITVLYGIGDDVDTYLQTKKFYSLQLAISAESANDEATYLLASVEEIEDEEIAMVQGMTLQEFTENSSYKKFFSKFSSKLADGMTLVLSVAASAVLAYKLSQDFDNDAATFEKVLDTLRLTITFAETVCIGLTIATNLAKVPVVGAVLAFVGAVVALVQLILEKNNPEESDADKFIDQEAAGFFDGITVDQNVVNESGNDAAEE